MDKIPSVAERVAEMPTNKCPVCDGDGCTVEHDQNDPTGQTPIQVQCDFCHAEGKITTLDCVTNTLTAQHTALLTELRQVITKKLTTRTYKIITQYEPNSIASITIPANQESAYNLGATITLKDLQAHLDELINPTNV